jgi:serine/threonine-protein kinase HipA
MSYRPVDLLTVHYAPDEARRIRVGRLARAGREILFEYDPAFLATGIELSPFRLPATPGVVAGDPALFQGLMGLFDDSLPDGWGRLLLDRRIAREGIHPATLGPLDRLGWVGSRGMGALVYEPEFGDDPPTVVDLAVIAREAETIVDHADAEVLKRLIMLGGSPQGARPKALIQVSGSQVLYGAGALRPGFTPYLVKFPAPDDEPHAARLELAYSRMARAAGIDVPETRLLGGGRRGGFFATRRFDRDGSRRFHLHTLCGLLHAPHTLPSLSYRDLLLATRQLTRNEADVREMFRRACFNVFAHNRDDHTKNFAFLMDHDGAWRASPAYDLTFSHGPGGEHTLLVAGEGRAPTARHLEALAREADLKRFRDVIDEVRRAVKKFPRFADEAGVPKRARDRVAKILAP